jgi:hypothetical protein
MQIRLTQQKPFRLMLAQKRAKPALGGARDLPLPSLKGLAFYSLVVAAVMVIWPSARFAALAYEVTGFVTLLAFMAFVFTIAIALGAAAVKLLYGDDRDT